MAKIYPFRYKFASPDIKPIDEDLWFQSHQALLLRILATDEGRELLCIDKKFNGLHIVEFSKNHVTGYLGHDNGKDFYKSDFRMGSKWGNIVRCKWPTFVKLARKHYDYDGLCQIFKDREYMLAATTSTFYPAPSPDSPVDGQLGRDQQASWSAARDGTSATTFASDGSAVSAVAEWLVATSLYRVFWAPTLFNTSSIPDTDNIKSADYSTYGLALGDDYGDSLHAVECAPASDSVLEADDFDNLTFTSLGSKTLASSGTSQYNAISITDLSKISKTSLTKLGTVLGRHLLDQEPTIQGNRNFYIFSAADTAGITQDPELEVVHSRAGHLNLLLMGVG